MDTALVLAEGCFGDVHGKVAHGLIRSGSRFQVQAVVDSTLTGRDAGEVLDGTVRGIPIAASIPTALAACPALPRYCVVGMATHGGRLTPTIRKLMLDAVEAGMAIVNGLHELAAGDAEIAAAAERRGLSLIDLRRPRPNQELHFWTGDIVGVRAPRIAVLGMDCAIGKRTTARLLLEALQGQGFRAEMIHTGQTGWMQGSRYGFILDATPNDYVSGELEHAILTCEQEARPHVMIIEGQSSMRNPSGPCGPELLLSGGAQAVVLQHAPGRVYFEGFEAAGFRIPPVADEIRLLALYGARTLAVTLNTQHLGTAERAAHQRVLQQSLDLPVVAPLDEGIEALLPSVRELIRQAYP